MQEALLAAATHVAGARAMPDNPLGWLVRVASRRHDRPVPQRRGPPPPGGPRRARGRLRRARAGAAASDDTLILHVHVLPPVAHAGVGDPAHAAGGRRAHHRARSPRAFLVPEATMAQRISRAKAKIKASGEPFRAAAGRRAGRAAALGAARPLPALQRGLRHAAAGPDLARRRPVRRGHPADPRRCTPALPDDAEVAGLLALMLLTDARRPARTGADGELSRWPSRTGRCWDRALIAEGVALITDALRRGAGRRVPAAGGDRRGARPGRHATRTPTGRRSSRSTGCSSG